MRLVVTEGFVLAVAVGRAGAAPRLVDAVAGRRVRDSDRAAAARRSHAGRQRRRLHRRCSWRSPACCPACGPPSRPRGSTCCACSDRRAPTPRVGGRRRCAAGSSARRSPGSTAFLAVAALFVQSYSSLADDRSRLRARPAGGRRVRTRAARLLRRMRPSATSTRCSTRVRALPGVADAAVADRAPFFIGFERLTPVWPQGGACAGDACPKVATYAVGAGVLQDDGDSAARGAGVRRPQARRRSGGQRSAGAPAVARRPRPRRDTARRPRGRTAHGRRHRGEQPRSRPANGPRSILPMRAAEYEGGLTVVAQNRGPARAARAAVHRGGARGRSERGDAVGEDDAAAPGRAAVAVPDGELGVHDLRAARAGSRDERAGRRGDPRREPALREFGVRMSVGATPRDLVVDVLRGSVAAARARSRRGPRAGGDRRAAASSCVRRRERAESADLPGGGARSNARSSSSRAWAPRCARRASIRWSRCARSRHQASFTCGS